MSDLRTLHANLALKYDGSDIGVDFGLVLLLMDYAVMSDHEQV